MTRAKASDRRLAEEHDVRAITIAIVHVDQQHADRCIVAEVRSVVIDRNETATGVGIEEGLKVRSRVRSRGK